MSNPTPHEYVPAGTEQRLLSHPLYESLKSIDDIRRFMREHVFAVWDFMSLLKRLQRDLAGCELPWVAPSDLNAARMVNEIVLGEESDEDGLGGFVSHFGLYRQAMAEVGADQGPIDEFLQALREGQSVHDALGSVSVLETTRRFVEFNTDLAVNGRTHEVAAAFCFGRETIIPDMFRRILACTAQAPGRLDRFRYYLDRHIEVDGDQHGPLAQQMLQTLCDGRTERIQEAAAAATAAVEARIAFWDGVLESFMPAARSV